MMNSEPTFSQIPNFYLIQRIFQQEKRPNSTPSQRFSYLSVSKENIKLIHRHVKEIWWLQLRLGICSRWLGKN
jgi:hypothetical protein